MKIKQQVANLELSKQLEKLGVKQESVWYWATGKAMKGYELFLGEKILPDYEECKKLWKKECTWKLVSAFTVSELGELLPDAVATYRYKTYDDDRDIWACIKYVEGNHEKYEYVVHTKTEANVRAKMLIYLIKNKLIKL